MVKRVLVGYGIDVDAVSGWINTASGAPANPTDVSRGIFGATVGIDRLLKLWDKYGIKTTWFVPAHSMESFPSQLQKIRDAGHEIGLHGYCHEHVGVLSEQQQRDVMKKSVDVVTEFLGKKPRGWTAPAWSTSKETIQILEEFGLEYDHSFMHHDCQLYYAPDLTQEYKETNIQQEASTWMTPMTKLRPSKIVEVPANWHLDDWPPLQVNFKSPSGQGYVDPDVIEKLWKKQFDYFYREYDTFFFPMTIHPQVSGKPQVILMHESIIEYISSHEGVEWVTLEQMVDEFKAGRMKGATVEGGV
ncbi:glucose 1-dehydrogenase [Xylogone sp. PMI_703]|nr:glucose 1-dehydrogenase [Xylogone sp. PMI_703]